MTACQQCQFKIGKLEGRFDDERLGADVGEHIADCEACSEFLRAHRLSDTMLHFVKPLYRTAKQARGIAKRVFEVVDDGDDETLNEEQDCPRSV